jgi:prepilin-type N-terminal cleavage/methylation domain-containing protein
MRTRGRRAYGDSGWTIVELMLVVVILGIVSAIAVQTLDTDELALDAAARATAADLQRAQSLAIETRVAFGVRFDTGNNSSRFVLATGSTARSAETSLRATPGLTASDVERLLDARTSGDPDFGRVTLSAASFAGTSQITFRPDGSPSSDGLVEFRHGGQWLRVRVQDASGRITITAP